MPKRSFLVVAVLVVLAGCGTATATDGGGAVRQPATPTGKQDNRHRFQAIKADCMKRKGFRYVPYVSAMKGTDEQEKDYSGDYAAMKARRSKYGFEIFSWFVYPREMGNPAARPADAPVNPNFAIKNDLSPAQQDAYDEMSEACDAQAYKQITGKVVKSMDDWSAQTNALIDQRTGRELDGDPKLVELASAMADCLTGKGYRLTSTKPTAMNVWGWRLFTAERDEIASKDDTPETDLPKGHYYLPRLTPARARPLLDREIKVALEDLECGREFYPAFRPRNAEIVRQVEAEYGA
ncbi:hypothetical protein [Streptosporangium carneum]|nr:hypothetical protein [Streptosporangium carneum]